MAKTQPRGVNSPMGRTLGEPPPFQGRAPDYNVSAIHKGTGHRGQIGAAWKKDDGSIQIRLHAFVVLSAVQDIVITLFPREPNEVPQRGRIAEAVEAVTVGEEVVPPPPPALCEPGPDHGGSGDLQF